MRVVIVCDPGSVDGGASKVAIASARGLACAGLRIDYICTAGPCAPELDHPNIAVHCLDMASVWTQPNPAAAAAQGIWNGSARTQVENILRRLQASDTVVHFHQWTKSFSPSVLAAPSRLGMASIVSLHDYFLACPNGAYYRFPTAAPCTLVPMSGSCLTARCDRSSSLHKAVRVARQFATGQALSRAGSSLSVLSVSSFAERVIEPFIPKQHRRFVVHSPIDVEKDGPVPVAGNSQFVFVGRMTAEKGVRQLAQAALQADLPVTFVGGGPLLEEIRNLSGSIRCTGWLDASGVDDVLRRARAVVFPSTWYETGGLVVLEALARGIPVIVSRTTAAADFVVDGQNGFLIDAGGTSALRACLRELADDAVAERMGRQAFERYWANPQTMAAHVENLLRVYRAVLSDHQARPQTSAA
jgi:glycosyltransferase involved in cell wall biosynthesis